MLPIREEFRNDKSWPFKDAPPVRASDEPMRESPDAQDVHGTSENKLSRSRR